MSVKQIRYTARILLLLYIGYFGCVSYFVHKHVYNGVVYIHSHPYKKWAKEGDKNDNKPPFETHNHTAAGFFSINQLSNYTSFEACDIVTEKVYTCICNRFYIIPEIDIANQDEVAIFRLRAPPTLA